MFILFIYAPSAVEIERRAISHQLAATRRKVINLRGLELPMSTIEKVAEQMRHSSCGIIYTGSPTADKINALANMAED